MGPGSAPVHQETCKEADKRGELLDICQQWRMAGAAKWQAERTNDFYNLTFYQSFGLIATVIASFIAAYAEIRSVRVAQDIAKKELMANVYFAPGALMRGTELFVSVIQGNSGQTPAKHVRTRIYSAILTLDEFAADQFPVQPYGDGQNDLAAGFSFPSNIVVDNYESIEQLESMGGRESEKKIFVFAEAAYMDAFDKERVTRASWFYIHSRGNVAKMGTTGGLLPPFEFTKENNYIDRHNDDGTEHPRGWFARSRLAFGLWIAGLSPNP